MTSSPYDAIYPVWGTRKINKHGDLVVYRGCHVAAYETGYLLRLDQNRRFTPLELDVIESGLIDRDFFEDTEIDGTNLTLCFPYSGGYVRVSMPILPMDAVQTLQVFARRLNKRIAQERACARVVALMSGLHPRLGEQSPLRLLDVAVVRDYLLQ